MTSEFENLVRSLRQDGSISRKQFHELLRAGIRHPRNPVFLSLEPLPQLLESWRKDGVISGYDYNRLIDALKPPTKETLRASRERMLAKFRKIDGKHGKGSPIVQGGLPSLGKRRP